MTRIEIIAELKKYFNIQELVCNHTYNKFGDRSWQFLQTELLHNLLIVRRDILKCAIIINEPHRGLFQRGLRCNLCQLVKDKTDNNEIYLSSHVNGAGNDLHPKGMTAAAGRNMIAANSHLLPYPIRLEKDVPWIHMDVYDSGNGQQVTYF